MKNRLVIFVFLLFMIIPSKAQSIWDREHLEYVKRSLDNPCYSKAYQSLLKHADKALEEEPLSVMMKEWIPASGDMHDYMSLARYYWPDPTTPDGLPYINRDGMSNPELEKLDRNRLSTTANRIETLSLAWYFTGDEKYAKKAVEFIEVWFLNKKTRMNPNLEYAQMVPGRNGGKGRGFGVLDTYSFVEMLDAVALLDSSKSFTARGAKRLKQWFCTLLDWILSSDQGRSEKNQANNHGTAYDVQVVAFALYAGQYDLAHKVISDFPKKRTFTQIMPDGSQPHELRRTLSFHYSQYNLTHYIDMYLMARKLGVDIDHAVSSDGRNFYKAMDFLVQYVGDDAKEWKWQQISGWNSVEQKFYKDLYRTAVYLDTSRNDYLNLYDKYARNDWRDLFNILYLKK